MRRRLLVANVFVAIVGVVVLGVPLAIAGARLERDEAVRRLDRYADVVGIAVEDRLERRVPLTSKDLAHFATAGRYVAVIDDQGRRTVSGAVPPHALGATVRSAEGAVVVVKAPATEVDRRVRRVLLIVTGLAVAGVASATAIALLVARRVTKPLRRLASVSARLGAGDFSARVGRQGIPEIDAAADALDHSAGRIGGLVAREREFSANASHQLRTPLTALRLRIESIADPTGVDDARAQASDALAEADRLDATITQLLALAREGRVGDAVDVDVVGLIRAHAQPWREVLTRAGRPLTLRLGDTLLARVTPGALGQALEVVVDNAVRHGAGAVTIEAATARTPRSIRVEDQGSGIEPKLGRRIFERDVSTGATGIGLGLPLARTLVESDGGRLELVQDAPAVFEIFLAAPPAA